MDNHTFLNRTESLRIAHVSNKHAIKLAHLWVQFVIMTTTHTTSEYKLMWCWKILTEKQGKQNHL